MKVRDAMTEDVLTITPGRSLREAAKFMTDHTVGAVVIMDPEQPGPGIVTERDLVRSLGRGEDPDVETVVICRTGARSGRAVRQLQAAGFRKVFNLAGGIHRWADEVDPSLPKY